MLWILALLVLGGTVAGAQSVSASNSCLRRSVLVYTSESSTYLITDIGSTSFATTTTFCQNGTVATSTSVSTVYGTNLTVTTALPPSTVTVYAQPTSSTQPADPSVVVANSNFEGGSETPFDTSASSPDITAEVVSSGPIQPYDGDGYLLITFNSTASRSARVKRQANAPLVYNITQVFSASAGTAYTLSAYASDAQNGNIPPVCSLTICGQGDCSAPFPLTTSYSPYTYTYNAASSNGNAVATFSVQCQQAAYVALDNINVVASGQSNAQVTRTLYITQTIQPNTIVRSQVFTQVVPITATRILTETTSISGSNIIFTTAVPTIIYSTITATEQIRSVETATAFVTQTAVSAYAQPPSTLTTTHLTSIVLTRTLSQPASLVYETVTATTTGFVTRTQLSLSSYPASASTSTVTQLATLLLTTTLSQPPSIVYQTVTATSTSLLTYSLPQQTWTTTEGRTVIPPALTEVQTSLIYSTRIVTNYVSVTLPRQTDSVPFNIPQATYTPPAQTIYSTVTLSPLTMTSYISVTPPPVTQYLTSTLPRETFLVQQTLTQTLAATYTASGVERTVTAPGQTITQTISPSRQRATTSSSWAISLSAPSASSVTLFSTSVSSAESSTAWSLPMSSEFSTSSLRSTIALSSPSSISRTSSSSSLRWSTTLSSSSLSRTSSSSSLQSSNSPSPTSSVRSSTTYTSGCPATTSAWTQTTPQPYLSQPTTIFSSTTGHDDETASLALPFPLSIYGVSSSSMVISVNGILGWAGSSGRAPTTQTVGNILPQFNSGGDTTAIPLWWDTYIRAGTPEGITYQVTGTAPNRIITFEFNLERCCNNAAINGYLDFYHYLVIFYEARPNVVTYRYLDISSFGHNSVVGIQSYSGGQRFLQYSYDQEVIYPGLQLTFDTSSSTGMGTYTVDAPGNPCAGRISYATTDYGYDDGYGRKRAVAEDKVKAAFGRK